MLQENVTIEEQIAKRKRLIETELREASVRRQAADFAEARRRESQREIDAIRMGGNTADLNNRLNTVSDEFRSQRRGIDDDFRGQLASIPLSDSARRNELQAEYNRLIGITVIAEAQALAQEKELFKNKLAAQSDWRNGMVAAMEDYKAQAENVAGTTQRLFTNMFQGMEDLIVQFVMTGKVNFGDFVKSVIADFARMEARILLSKAFEWITSMAMSYFSSGANTSSGLGAYQGAASGGSFVGPRAKGAAYDGGVEYFAKGGTFTNQIVSQPTMFRFGNGGKFGEMGEAGPEAIMPLARDSSGKLGVAAMGMGGGGGGNVFHVETNIFMKDGGSSSQRDNGSDSMAAALGEMVEGEVKRILIRESQQGGIIWRREHA